MNRRYPIPSIGRRMLAIGSAFLFACTGSVICALPGEVDPGFQPNTPINGPVYAVARQDDGRWLIGGNFTHVGGIDRGRVARLNADGSLDHDFMHEASGADGPVRAISIRSDGRILIGGEFTSVNGIQQRGIARLTREGTLDDTFTDSVLGSVFAFEEQPDGGIVVGGDFTHIRFYSDNGSSFTTARNRIARLDEDGNLDSYFGTGPQYTGAPGGANDNVYAIALQTDGKILIGGDFTDVDGEPLNRIARLNTEGKPDENFTPGPGVSGRVNDIVLDSDNNILVAGRFLSAGGEVSSRIARFHPDGTIDSGFNANIPVVGEEIHSLALQDDGKVVIAGTFTNVNGLTRNRIARLNPDGTVDPSFGQGLEGASRTIFAITLTPDGRIFAGGNFLSINTVICDRIALLTGGTAAESDVRLDHQSIGEDEPVGAVVGSFSAIGPDAEESHTFVFASGEGDEGNGHFMIDEGSLRTATEFDYAERNRYTIRIRATSTAGLSSEKVFAVTVRPGTSRAERPGMLVTSFDPGEIDGRVRAVARQGDGKWIIGGDFTTVQGYARGGVARLHRDGRLDHSFMNGLAGADGAIHAIAVQDNGKVLIGGSFMSVNGTTRGCLARLNSDGTLDSGFHDPLTISNAVVSAIDVGSDNRILIGGDFNWFYGFESFKRYGFAQLLSNGTLDESFGVDGSGAAHVQTFARGGGRIVIGGGFNMVNGESRQRIARLNGNGTLDPVFTQSQPVASGSVNAALVQSDGRILIAGEFWTVNWEQRRGIARLRDNGRLDTFAGDLAGPNGNVLDIGLQPDGRVLLGGLFTEVHGIPRNYIARLNPDGSIDSTFADGEKGANGSVSALTIDPADGSVLIAGSFSEVNGVSRQKVALLHGSPLPPSDILLSHQMIEEARPAGTPVGTFTAIVPDEFATLTFELAEGEGDSGNSFFQIDGDLLKTTAILQYETATSHTIRVRASIVDGPFYEKVFEITIAPNQPPGDILLTENSVYENLPPGVEIGTFSALDPDDNETHSFTLVDGAGADGNESFVINGDTLKTAVALDYESAASHSIRVRVTDRGGLYFEKAFVIEVIPNQRPTDVILSDNTIIENRPVGTLIGTLTAVDPDEEDMHTFTLVTRRGGDEHYFEIDGDALKSAVVFDYETRNSYTIRIRATDRGGLSLEKDFAITVTRDPYRGWAASLPDDERSGEDDPGDLGIPNILRYAFDMDPLRPERKKLPRISMIEAGPEPESTQAFAEDEKALMYLTFSYIRRVDDPALLYIVEISGDLENWLPFEGFEEVVDDNNGETETVTVIDSESIADRDKRFLRVRVER